MLEEESAEEFEDKEWVYYEDHENLKDLVCLGRDFQEQEKVGFDLY
jgi:hypothetical protein